MLLDGYIRVSQVAGRRGDRFISPSVQREQIEAWTAANNAVLGEVFEELDQSGGRADRPLLMAAIERVERGESDGVAVAKLDRFGRSLVDGLRALARIEDAGGTFVSVTDGIDSTTPTGKLVMRILFAIGEWELERVRSNWESARGRAIGRGLYIGRKGPIGYRRGEDGRLRIDPLAAPLIREVFERRARGQNLKSIAAFLNDSELETEKGRPFQEHSVQRIIVNSAYRGEAHSGVHRNADAHEPIVDAATWQTAQGKGRVPLHSVQTLCSGLLRCADCGRMMSPTRPQGERSRLCVYRCWGQRGPCREPAHAANDELDPLIEEYVMRIASRPLRPSASELAVAEREAAIEQAEESLVAYRDNPRLLRTLGADSFEAGLAARRRTVERRLLELARAKRALQRPRVELEGLEERWAGLSWAERREAVAEVVDCVVVARGSAEVIERAWIFGRGRGPVVGGSPAVGSLPAATRGAKRLRTPRRWSEKRTERELRAFLGGRSRWPSYLEFADAGRARLHAQVLAWGSPFYWGAKLGVEVGAREVKWTETRLRDALAPLLADREEWPAAAEFRAAGMYRVYLAVVHHGGIEHWAEELGVKYKAKAPKPKQWSKERIEPLLVAFVGDRDTFPTMGEFEAAGKARLHSALYGHGGRPYWARRLGLRLIAGSLDLRK